MMSMRFEVVDGCPVPLEAAPMVHAVKAATGETLNSCFRGHEARAILAAYGKHDQTYLYDGFVRGLKGFNPANRPGTSPHECYSDGVSPPGFKVGQRIPDTLVGQDWTNAARVIAAYRSMGVPAYHPYSSSREQQHVGIAKVPKFIPPPLKEGVRDAKRVVALKHDLKLCVRPHGGGKHYWTSPDFGPTFTAALAKAVRDFQHDHGLHVDGVVGHMTQVQLDHSVAYWRSRTSTKPVQPSPVRKVIQKVHPKTPVKVVTPGPFLGIDVYEGDGDVDWAKVRAANYRFAFCKATEGLTYTDRLFTAGRLNAARHAGVLVGCYHFARPQPGRSAVAEANHFLRVVRAAGGCVKGDLPPVLDIEAVVGLGTKQLQDWVTTWCKTVQAALGVKPIIYTGAWFWNPRLGNPARGFSGYPLWLAAYVRDARSYVPKAWKSYTFWQYTDKGTVPGVQHACDLSRFEGSLESLRALTIR